MSDIIQKRRDELHLTLLDIAKKIGVSEATVQRYGSGSIKNIRQDKIAKLAAVLQITPAQLLGWEEIQSEETINERSSMPDIDPKETKSRIDDPDQIFSFLEKLADLHDKGILTDEEYIGKKRELLDRI